MMWGYSLRPKIYGTMWGPLVISSCITPSKYGFNYHKPFISVYIYIYMYRQLGLSQYTVLAHSIVLSHSIARSHSIGLSHVIVLSHSISLSRSNLTIGLFGTISLSLFKLTILVFQIFIPISFFFLYWLAQNHFDISTSAFLWPWFHLT